MCNGPWAISMGQCCDFVRRRKTKQGRRKGQTNCQLPIALSFHRSLSHLISYIRCRHFRFTHTHASCLVVCFQLLCSTATTHIRSTMHVSQPPPPHPTSGDPKPKRRKKIAWCRVSFCEKEYKPAIIFFSSSLGCLAGAFLSMFCLFWFAAVVDV